MQAIEESSDRIAAERGGAERLSMGEMLDLANDFAIDAAKVNETELARLFGGAKNLNAKVWALRQAVKQSADMVHQAAVRARDSGKPEDVVAAAQALMRHDMIQSTLSSVTTEAGRALGMAFRNMEDWGKARDLNQFMRDTTGRDLYQWNVLAKLASRLDNVNKISKLVDDGRKRGFWNMVVEYWVNGLISGPTTHITYSIGNNVLMLEKAVPETAAAALIGRVRRALGRPGETVRMGEVAAGLRGIRAGVAPALKGSFEAMRSGVTARLPGEEEGAMAMPLMPGADLAEQPVANLAADVHDAMTAGYGIFRGIKEAFMAGGDFFQAEGQRPAWGWRQSPLGAIPDLDIGGVTLPVGTLARLPSRGVATIHTYFRIMNYSIDINQQAFRIASNEGLVGTAFDARVAELRTNPTPEMMTHAHEAANQLTLMGQGGKFTQLLSQLSNTPILGIPIFKFVDPFVKISSNIIDQALLQRTPLGIMSSEIRADLLGKNGNIAQDMAMARMLMGTAYAITIGGLAAEGYISGSGPSDPNAARIWRLAGNQAHSIRIGDTWFDMHRLGPMGLLMGVAADMYDVANAASQGDMLHAGSLLQHAITQNILDESFMRGPSDLIKAVDDPGRYGDNYIRTTLSSFLPYSVGLAQMARATDPYSRQARTVMDAIRDKVPGMSESLLPRRDIWGDPLPNRDAVIAAGVTAIYEQQMSRDPVNLALLQLGIYPAMVTRRIRNVQLTDDQYDDYQRIAGRLTKQRLDAIVRSPDFQYWPAHIQRDVIREVILQARETARGMMMFKYPQIVRDATQARIDKLNKD